MPETPAPSTLRKPWRDLARNLALSAGVTLFFLALLEGLVRLSDLAPGRTLAFPDAETWAAFPGPFEPGQEFVNRLNPELPHVIRVNSLGFRGPDFQFTKRPGVFRILCLGDSYTFGDYVNEGETLPAALGEHLRRRRPGRTFEVINAGVNGYTITDEAALAEEKGFALQPDLVMVTFVLNDLADLTRRVSSRENQRNEARRMSRSPLTPVKRLLRQTALYNLLFKLKARAMARARLDPTLQDLPQRHLLRPPFSADTERLFARYGEELRGLAESAARHGASLILVLFPFYEQVVQGAPPSAQERMSRIAEEAGVLSVDLHPPFLARGEKAEALFLMPLNHHPSAEGYRAAADEVGEAVLHLLD
jgi:lysophospholipase L1-like esterase